MPNEVDRYARRGVSSSKEGVHAAVSKLDKGIFPGAFCKILPDILTGSSEHCVAQHADGSGTKAILAYLVWKKTGDISVWRGIIRDSLFMNLDDLGCVGALGPFLITLTINRNKFLIPDEVIDVLISETQVICDWLTSLGIPCHFAGGETADLGDSVRTITIDHTVTCRLLRDQVIDASRIKSPAVIIGFSTTGQAVYEDVPNSGIGSNGLTNARHETLCDYYQHFRETYAPEMPRNLVYCGHYYMDWPLPLDPSFTIASALLSPTRTYLPIIKHLMEFLTPQVLGFIHCSGGGQTKIGKFGQPGIVYLKDSLFPTPPLFRFLQETRQLPWREMFSSYNMGHRLEVVVESELVADVCVDITEQFGLETKIVGHVIPANNPKIPRQVIIRHEGVEEKYPSDDVV